jgi:hypothetical protein
MDQPSPQNPTKALSFLTSNFAALSALTVIFAVLWSTVFLSAYLSVFDWQLIWIIEYPDVFYVDKHTIIVPAGDVLKIQRQGATAN